MKTHLGHYEIVAELGRGGMGVVYKGYEPALGRQVAIKELSAALAHDSLVVERFLREARAMALLNDPHIIQIYAIGQDNDQPFFVMEFVEGASVAALLRRDSRLPPGDALKITHQAAQGLATAHTRGVIHRDVKPANLMISDRGLVKIADFGIALANQEIDPKLTSAGELVGTPGYLSPEILQGSPVDQRSDIYALGVVLFEMLIGRTPFSDVSVYKLIQTIVETPVPDVRELDPEIDAETAAIIARTLSKDPSQRYQQMSELVADLERHPLIARGGTLQTDIASARETIEDVIEMTMVSVTPNGGARTHGPLPDLGRPTPRIASAMPPPIAPLPAAPVTPTITPAKIVPAPGARSVASRPATAPNRTADGPERSKPGPAEAAPEPIEKSRSPWPFVVGLVLLLAGTTYALRLQLFGTRAEGDPAAVYAVAAIITVLGLAISGFWFGVHRRRKVESAAGVHSLANMKWRDCIGLVLEAMHRDGYDEVPASKQLAAGDTEFLLLRDDKRYLLDYKHGTAYKIIEANVRDFANGVHLLGAAAGILVTLGTADSLARDTAKRLGVQVVDGATLWPKVRQFVSPDILDHVRLQAAAQTRKGLWIGCAASVLLGATIFLLGYQGAAGPTPQLAGESATPIPSAVASAASSAERPADPAAASATATPSASTPTNGPAADPIDPGMQQINAAAQAMAEVAKLTDVQRAQRRAEAARKMSSIVQIGTAAWSTQSTLLLALQQSDGSDTAVISEACRILTQYEELRYTRLQLQPPEGSAAPVRFRQCQAGTY